jgi:hypothetical protein
VDAKSGEIHRDKRAPKLGCGADESKVSSRLGSRWRTMWVAVMATMQFRRRRAWPLQAADVCQFGAQGGEIDKDHNVANIEQGP